MNTFAKCIDTRGMSRIERLSRDIKRSCRQLNAARGRFGLSWILLDRIAFLEWEYAKAVWPEEPSWYR